MDVPYQLNVTQESGSKESSKVRNVEPFQSKPKADRAASMQKMGGITNQNGLQYGQRQQADIQIKQAPSGVSQLNKIRNNSNDQAQLQPLNNNLMSQGGPAVQKIQNNSISFDRQVSGDTVKEFNVSSYGLP